MSEVYPTQVVAQHARHRAGRRSNHQTHDTHKNTASNSRDFELRDKNVNILNLPSSGHPISAPEPNTEEPFEGKLFEFVTITTQPSVATKHETSKKVRTQAMRDYLRKQNRQAITGIVEENEGSNFEEPAKYKGRFKLNTWSHKARRKVKKPRLDKSPDVREDESSPVTAMSVARSTQVAQYDFQELVRFGRIRPNPVFPGENRLDPFDSLALRLRPQSEKLLVHYNTMYSMNSVAVNAEQDFFSHVKVDPALFHSILYLVALHYDLKHGLTDSLVCLYHGGEAFRIINERLCDVNGLFNDMTIGAVAMLVNKENLNGRYELSRVHMQGLELMVRMRGGVEQLQGIFQRIVTWCDFCSATAWNCQPVFPRFIQPPTSSPPLTTHESDQNKLKASHLFGTSSPIVSIFQTLRALSSTLTPTRILTLTNSSRLQAANEIYTLEYSLLELNILSSVIPDPDRCRFAFEAIPLKIAAHLYLWLVIRNLPPTSLLLYTVVKRLQDALMVQLPGWWKGGYERRVWLLWILCIGAVASRGRIEKGWFVGELVVLCREVGVWDKRGLIEALGTVVLQEEFFEELLDEVWEEVGVFWEGEVVRGAGSDAGFIFEPHCGDGEVAIEAW